MTRTRKLMMIIGGIAVVIVLAIVLGWIGLQIKPDRFPAYIAETGAMTTVPLPNNLPAPVDRFYRTAIGDDIPVIESAVITGTAPLRLMGITFPARYRFVHEAGQNYRHYIELTMFGQKITSVNEFYLDGKGRMELPVGTTDNDPKVNQAANLGLWAESILFPSIYITDPRVRWEAIDDTHARLIVPAGESEESFTVTFDPTTGLITTMEAMRYKGTGDKIRWTGEMRDWTTIQGMTLPGKIAAIWSDEGSPWVVFAVEDVVYNVDVSDYIRQHGL